MADKQAVKDMIKGQIAKNREVMNSEYLRQEFLTWLGDMPCPIGDRADRWEDWLELFEREPSDEDRTSGLRIWAALRLYTGQNRYLITILESFRPTDIGVYFATAHVSWRVEDKNRQERLDRAYAGEFDDGLRHRHMLWAQTFRTKELQAALSACAKTILGNELCGTPPKPETGETLQLVTPQRASFPKADE